MSVIGAAVASSSSMLMRKRPSAATSYCRPICLSTPPAHDACGKEHHRRAGFERVPHHGDRRRHHFARRVQVVQLCAVGPPHRHGAARRGDLPLPPRRGRRRTRRVGRDKRPHVSLHAPRFVRVVGHPPAVGRELPVSLIERPSRETPTACDHPPSAPPRGRSPFAGRCSDTAESARPWTNCRES